MNYIFSFFLLSGIGFFIAQGKAGEIVSVMTEATSSCGSFVLKLLFLTAFFSGVIQIAEDGGIVAKISRFLMPLLRRIFSTKDKAVLGKISVNIGANLLGIGNAATPSGLNAMKLLDEENNHLKTPSEDMCTFLLFNTCSIQLIPTTIMALRAMAGSETPSAIVLPVILVSFLSLLCGLFLCRVILRIENRRNPL